MFLGGAMILRLFCALRPGWRRVPLTSPVALTEPSAVHNLSGRASKRFGSCRAFVFIALWDYHRSAGRRGRLVCGSSGCCCTEQGHVLVVFAESVGLVSLGGERARLGKVRGLFGLEGVNYGKRCVKVHSVGFGYVIYVSGSPSTFF